MSKKLTEHLIRTNFMGISDKIKNFRKLLLHKPDFLAISGAFGIKNQQKQLKNFMKITANEIKVGMLIEYSTFQL